MKIKKWIPTEEQCCDLGKSRWAVARLLQLSNDLPVFDADLNCLNLFVVYDNLSIRDMVTHMQAVQDADLSFPIILDEDGMIMDGRHRIMKALLLGHDTIRAVRFDENPTPCSVKE